MFRLRAALLALSLAVIAGVVASPQAVAATDYQAENATISQGVVESNHAGFTGTGFVNYTTSPAAISSGR